MCIRDSIKVNSATSTLHIVYKDRSVNRESNTGIIEKEEIDKTEINNSGCLQENNTNIINTNKPVNKYNMSIKNLAEDDCVQEVKEENVNVIVDQDNSVNDHDLNKEGDNDVNDPLDNVSSESNICLLYTSRCV